FRLSVEQLEGLERFGRKSAENLYANIQKAKRRPLERIIASLGIPQVGWTTAIELAHWLAAEVPAGDDWLVRAATHLQAVAGEAPERFQEIEGVGPTVAEALATWVAEGGPGQGVLEDLADAGGEDGRRHRLDRGLQPGGSGVGAQGGGRQTRRLGIEEDGLRRRRRGGRL